MKESEINILIGEIVAADYRAASVFKRAGIDFCCGGKKSIDQACLEKGIEPEQVREELNNLKDSPSDPSHNFIEWDLGFLCDYIMNTHHKFVIRALPELIQYTQKISQVHGAGHPELNEVADLFSQINRELLLHLKKEEEVLFPAIKSAVAGVTPETGHIIKSEIARMSNEHEFAGGAMDRINQITKNYSVPHDGCNSYHVTYKLLEQFEDDLHTHVHIENNILYPKALEIQEQEEDLFSGTEASGRDKGK
jgi:regulator of cell morphogenesis and NO signaling